MYYENRAQSGLNQQKPLYKTIPIVRLFEELRITTEYHKIGIGVDDLADVNHGPPRLGFDLRTFGIRIQRF